MRSCLRWIRPRGIEKSMRHIARLPDNVETRTRSAAKLLIASLQDLRFEQSIPASPPTDGSEPFSFAPKRTDTTNTETQHPKSPHPMPI